MFPEILHVFYGIVTFFCITFDALQMRLIVTDVVLTITGKTNYLPRGRHKTSSKL